jgi:hypothetical protein
VDRAWVEHGVLLEHVAHEARVLRLAGDLKELTGELHLAIVLLVSLVSVSSRLARLWHVCRTGHCIGELPLRARSDSPSSGYFDAPARTAAASRAVRNTLGCACAPAIDALAMSASARADQ